MYIIVVLYAPPLSNASFSTKSSFRQAQSALIGQLTQSIVIGRTLQDESEM